MESRRTASRCSTSASRQNRGEVAFIEAKITTLTPRKREVLGHVVAGRLNKQIACELGTVEKTIKFHRSRMMEKLGLATSPISCA
jgi:FixJ family two-component response regulator